MKVESDERFPKRDPEFREPIRLQLKTLLPLTAWLIIAAIASELPAQTADGATRSVRALRAEFNRLTESGVIVGAQVAIAHQNRPTRLLHFGVVGPDDGRAVDSSTVFLIGSCSKPFASACVLSLVDDPSVALNLDDTIDRWLPAFGNLQTKDGVRIRRAPTVEEVLAHRAGFYSQKGSMTKEQTKWIRRFDHTLAEAVEGISAYPLIASPGSRYAYSGAGYCVLGRVAEVASGRTIEQVLQQCVCQPLGLARTTFFPQRNDSIDAIAGGRLAAQAPHRLGMRHRFPLVGGSLYSTAEEMSRFGMAVVDGWTRSDNQRRLPISQTTLKQLGRVRSPASRYSIGWTVQQADGAPARLTHGGSLQSYRARLVVDLSSGTTVAACWTLGSVRSPTSANPVSINALIDAVATANPSRTVFPRD